MRIASYRTTITTTTTTTNPTPIRLERNRKRKYRTLFFAKPYKKKPTTENETIPVYKPNLVQIMQCIPSEQKSQIVILILANLLKCNNKPKMDYHNFCCKKLFFPCCLESNFRFFSQHEKGVSVLNFKLYTLSFRTVLYQFLCSLIREERRSPRKQWFSRGKSKKWRNTY